MIMDIQQMIAIVIVAAAAALMVRHYLGRKKLKSPACANCECGAGANTPEDPGGRTPGKSVDR
jgi:hypothetical protein